MSDDFQLEYSLEPITIYDISISGKPYLLREASEEVAVRFRNHGVRGLKLVDGKITGMDSVAEGQVILLSGCLFQQSDRKDEQGRPLSAGPVLGNTIRTWPARVVKPLFDKAREISGLNEEETEEVLVKRIAEDTKKLRELRVRRGATNGNAPAVDLSTVPSEPAAHYPDGGYPPPDFSPMATAGGSSTSQPQQHPQGEEPPVMLDVRGRPIKGLVRPNG